MKSTITSAKLPTSFPTDAAAWSKLIAEAPDAAAPATQEAAAQRNAVVVKGGGYVAVRDALVQKRQGQRGPQLAPTKLPVTVRYNPEVVAYFKATGAGWQTRMNDALCEWVAMHKTV
ncbi:MAG: hypothetical protein RL211_765 [Pseudomonadota bacterium]|jgi:uncharacterized protein (DUF4415 family)